MENDQGLDTDKEEEIEKTPLFGQKHISLDLCTPDHKQFSPHKSPVEDNHLPSLTDIIAPEQTSQRGDVVRGSPHQSPDDISHLLLKDLLDQEEQTQGEGLEEEFNSLRIKNDSMNSVKETSSGSESSLSNTSLGKQTWVKSFLSPLWRVIVYEETVLSTSLIAVIPGAFLHKAAWD